MLKIAHLIMEQAQGGTRASVGSRLAAGNGDAMDSGSPEAAVWADLVPAG